MRLIPVVDLKNGEVVQAVGGNRQHYCRLRSPLSESATLNDVADGLLKQYPSSTLYVADLDAIEGIGSHAGKILDYCRSHRDLELWLDAGCRTLADVSGDGDPPNMRMVVGTETLDDYENEMWLRARAAQDFILSLDFRGGDFCGPKALLEQPDLWPSQVIVMSLDAVGRDGGPDFKTVAEVIAQADGREVFAAGGARGLSDLQQLGALGAAGALVASALHAAQIKTGDLDEIAGF